MRVARVLGRLGGFDVGVGEWVEVGSDLVDRGTVGGRVSECGLQALFEAEAARDDQLRPDELRHLGRGDRELVRVVAGTHERG